MPINFPVSLDNFTNPTGSDLLSSVTVLHSTQHSNVNDAIEALEAKVGVNSSAVTTSLDYRITNLLPAADTQTLIKGSADATKLLRFEVDGFTTGTTRVLTPPNADITLAGQNFANVFTTNQHIDAHAAIGADSSLSDPSQLLFPSSVVSPILSVAEEFSGSAAGIDWIAGITSHLSANPADAAFSIYGADIDVFTKAGNNQNIDYLTGIYGSCYHHGNGDMSGYMAGMEYYAVNDGGGDVAGVYGVLSGAFHYGSGAVTTLTGTYISTFRDGGAGAVVNNVGIDVANISGGTNNFAIRTGTGLVSFGDNVQMANAKNFIFNTSTGTKIGTATSQKLSFWNATPIVQPTTAVAAATFVANAGTAVNDASTFDGYTIGKVVKALRNIGLLA